MNILKGKKLNIILTHIFYEHGSLICCALEFIIILILL